MGVVAIELVYSSKRYNDFTLAKCTVGMEFRQVFFFFFEDIYGNYRN